MRGQTTPGTDATRTLQVSPFAFALTALSLLTLLGLGLSLVFFSHLSSLAVSGWRAGATAMCQGKAAGISSWHRERQADLLETRAALLSLREHLVGTGQPDRREYAVRTLRAMRQIRTGAVNCKAIAILDPEGRRILSDPPDFPVLRKDSLPGVVESARRRSLVADRVRRTDGGEVLVGYFFPIDEQPQEGTWDVVLGMWFDAAPLLGGMLWPATDEGSGFENLIRAGTGEEVRLVKSYGSDPREFRVVFRSWLGSPEGPQRQRRTGLGFVRMTTEGPADLFEVAAAAEGTPWTLVARARPATLLGPLWFQSVFGGGLTSAMLITLGFGIFAFWHQKEMHLTLRLVRSELERSKLRLHYESVLGQAKDVVLWADTGGHILDANVRAVELYGYTQDEFRRMRIPDLRPPGARAESEATIQELRGAGRLSFSAVHQAKDGRVFPVEITAQLVSSEAEELILGIIRDVTDLERAEASVRETEDRLRTALRHASVIMARQDNNLRYTWWYGKRLPGRPGGHMPTCDDELFDPQEAARLKEIKASVLATGEGARTEVRRRGRSGDLWLDLVLEPERDSGGRVTGLINIMLDVTERKLAQALLESSEQKYRRLVEQIPGAVYARALNPEFTWLYISPQVDQTLGFTPLEWTRTPGLPERQIHPEDLRLVQSALSACLEQGQPVSLDYRIFHRDGRLLWFRDRISLATREDGSPSHIQGLLTDITEMRQAQEEARRLSIAIEHSPFSVAIADASGVVEYANAEFCRRLGRSREETLGRQLLELRPEYAHLAGPGELPQRVLAGSVLQGELPGKDRSGKACWERVVLAGTLERGRTAQHLVVISQDITEIRQYAEEVRQLQKMEAVGRLAGGIAHDFNNILTIVRGYSDLLLDEMGQDDPHRPPVEEIYKATERASQLIRQLLTFSRKQAAEPTLFNLNAAIEGASSMLTRLLGEDIVIQTDLDPELRLVRADPGQIGQILMNLAVNARDAMPQGGALRVLTRNVTVPASSEHAPPQPLMQPGEYVELAVEDDGCGIPPEVLPHIFEPFYTTKGAGKGTGLGLSTVYGIVQQCRGYIRAESPNGKGARFTIWLPAEMCERAAEGFVEPGTSSLSDSLSNLIFHS